MYRIRYDDQNRDLSNAMSRLDYLAGVGELTIVWVSARHAPALMLSCSPEHEAMLVEGLTNDLPGALLRRESIDHLREVLTEVQYVTRVPGDTAEMLQLVTQLDAAMVTCHWRHGRLDPIEIAVSDKAARQQVKVVLRDVWPGARVWPVRFPGTQELRPSSIMALPRSSAYLTLASRNTAERAFRQPVTSPTGLLVGSDANGNAVRLPRNSRTIWIGDRAPVNRVATWVTGRWPGRVLVLDASGGSIPQWQDTGRAVYVNWHTPGRCMHINPIMRLPSDDETSYVARVQAWLGSLYINEAVIGARMARLLRVYIKVLAAEQNTSLTPLTMLSLLHNPTQMHDLEHLAATVLNDEERQVWLTRQTGDSAYLRPGNNILCSLFDQYTELLLWHPPFTTASELLETRWTIIRVPTDNNGQRMYWAAMWPLLQHVYLRPDTLIVGLELGALGREVLRLSHESGATALLWASTLMGATGSQTTGAVLRDGAYLLAGAGPGAPAAARDIGVSVQALAAQAEDQAFLKTPDDLGSVRFRMPQAEIDARNVAGWVTASDVLPPAISLSGDAEASAEMLLGLLRNAMNASARVMVLCGNRDLWPALQDLGIMPIAAGDLPMLNPLDPPVLNRWLWWARGLKLGEDTVRAAHRAGVRDLQALCSYSEEQRGDHAAAAVLKDTLATGYFSWSEADWSQWFQDHPVVAVESLHPAMTRYLAMTAVEVRARLAVWDAPGFVDSDAQALQATWAILYPERLWIPDVVAGRTTNGSVATLPQRLQNLVGGLHNGEGFLYRRGAEGFTKVVISD